ncbi:MAG: hypothetical protein ACLGI8_00300 [Acidimicrobiia bacterium]|jgi:hypothetical protein
MRIATGLLASAAVLFVFGALGLVGSWALVTGTLIALVGGVGLVIQLEERDRSTNGLAAFIETR